MPEDLPSPRRTRRWRLSLVWVVPLAAAGVATWMLVREWRQRGPEIAVHFADGSGVRAQETSLDYKGVEVGTVTAVNLDPDLRGVTVHVQLRREAEALAREGSQFWIVQPRIGFSGISGLETIVSGVHLGVRPGGGPPATEFRGLAQAPVRPADEKGRAFRLLTDQLGTMHPGAPVLYRDFQIGEVELIQLGPMADVVEVRIRVEPPYTALVRRDSRFWNAGGVPLDFNFFGAKVDTASLRSIFTGAVGVATPGTAAEPAPEDMPFRLHAAPEEEWLRWHARIPIDGEAQTSAPEQPPAMPAVPTTAAPTREGG